MNKIKIFLKGFCVRIRDFFLSMLVYIDDRPVLKSFLLFLFACFRYIISFALILFFIYRFVNIIDLPSDTVVGIGIMTATISYLTLFLFYDPF